MDTFNLMIAGFVVVFGALGLHVASLAMRHANLQRELDMLDSLDKKPPKKKPAKKKATKSR